MTKKTVFLIIVALMLTMTACTHQNSSQTPLKEESIKPTQKITENGKAYPTICNTYNDVKTAINRTSSRPTEARTLATTPTPRITPTLRVTSPPVCITICPATTPPNPIRTKTPKDFDDTFTVEYCKKLYTDNKAELMEIYEEMTDAKVWDIDAKDEEVTYEDGAKGKLSKDRLNRIYKFSKDNDIEYIALRNNYMMIDYALEIYGLENAMQDNYWHTNYWLIYTPEDDIHGVIATGVRSTFVAYRIDNGWYMVKDGFCKPADLVNHFSDEELQKLIKAGSTW